MAPLRYGLQSETDDGEHMMLGKEALMVMRKDRTEADEGTAQETNEGTAQPQPPGRAWIAAGAIDAQGRRCDSFEKSALVIVTVCVHEERTTGIEARVALMGDVARSMPIPDGTPSLWVYPAGYFGFDAAMYARGNRAAAWPGTEPGSVTAKLSNIAKAHPAGAWIAFGVDLTSEAQEVWIIRADPAASDGWRVMYKVPRKPAGALANRCFDLDGNGLIGAFFVCSEIAAYEDQLSGCRLIVDLAHVRVPGTVWSPHPSHRWVHERVMSAASAHAAAVLAHHHAGQVVHMREHSSHQSNWILFRGDGSNWLDRAEVKVVL